LLKFLTTLFFVNTVLADYVSLVSVWSIP